MDNLDCSAELDFHLYHYTSIDTLFNIVEHSKALWATCVSYMNDSEEFLYGVRLLSELAQDRINAIEESEHDEPELINQKINSLLPLRMLTEFHLKGFKDASVIPFFSFSLSRQDNLLSQWRSYTPHGGGVCIGVSPEKIKEITADNKISLVKCLYENGEQRDFLNKVLDDYCLVYSTRFPHQAEVSHDSIEWFNRYLLTDVARCLLAIKNPNFSEEEEWRLISLFHYELGDDTVGYRTRNNILFPYVDFPLGKPPYFSSVLLGPSAHEELNLVSLKAFLIKSGEMASVYPSGIPYREW